MSDTPQVPKFNYGTSFQESLATIIFYDKKFAERMQEILQPAFFDLRYLEFLVESFYDYKAKFAQFPDLPTMEAVLLKDKDNIPDALFVAASRFYRKVVKTEEIKDEAFIKDTAIDFCKKQTLKEAIEKVYKLADISSYEDIRNIIDRALNAGSDNDFGYDYFKDESERFQEDDRQSISTGWPEIDGITKGGSGIGELTVIIAPTSAGKSFFLCHYGAEALLQGKNVVHYSLELHHKRVANRYDAKLANVSLNEIFERKDEILEKLGDVPGDLTIKFYPPHSATIEQIRSHIRRLEGLGKKPDLILVDYADLLKPQPGIDLRHALSKIYTDLRTIAWEFSVPVITASQTNRTGVDAEVITMEAISESFSKCFVADFIFTVARTGRDKVENTGRIFVAKNRNGNDGHILPLDMDPEFARIEILSSNHYESEITGDTENILKNKLRKLGRNL